jgi:uncharacterized membrane protein
VEDEDEDGDVLPVFLLHSESHGCLRSCILLFYVHWMITSTLIWCLGRLICSSDQSSISTALGVPFISIIRDDFNI